MQKERSIQSEKGGDGGSGKRKTKENCKRKRKEKERRRMKKEKELKDEVIQVTEAYGQLKCESKGTN